jgi:hypothetical protein
VELLNSVHDMCEIFGLQALFHALICFVFEGSEGSVDSVQYSSLQFVTRGWKGFSTQVAIKLLMEEVS